VAVGVGVKVGVAVGVSVGTAVGVAVGTVVGVAVGSSVGTSVGVGVRTTGVGVGNGCGGLGGLQLLKPETNSNTTVILNHSVILFFIINQS
jgi:hypothetical protein